MNSLNKPPRFDLPRLGFLVALACLAGGAYIGSSLSMAGIGFPLDDAWIHQTYARNLATLGEWSFIPGQVSAGSTAPLWSLILAIGHLVTSNVPFAFTFLIGTVCLIGIGWAGQIFFQDGNGMRFPWAGLFLVGEWHLVWAALSGMETALMGLMVVLALLWLDRWPERRFLGGLLIGLAVWVRPDGLTLLGPAGLVIVLTEGLSPRLVGSLTRLAGGFLCSFLPYLVFNGWVNGNIWPNTFYAKQAEYAVLLSQPLLGRIAQQFALPMTGAGLFLLPGFIYSIFSSIRQKRWGLLAAAIWFCGYALVYALRLPVVYQHGRYLMPAMPVFFIAGLIGTRDLIRHFPANRLGYVASRVGIASLALTWAGFLAIGARSYAQDVAIIQTEMVASARWISENTQPTDLVAAHDIGALGYFAGRNLVDLAGLVSPEVIPIIRDERALAGYLDERRVDYLVTFPDWYAELSAGKKVEFKTDGKYAPLAGGENMAVYAWR